MAHLFVSDLHLDAASPQAVEAFLGLLAGDARGAQALYILGDLFESWIGDDDPDPVRSRVCAALRSLATGGVPIFALHGNRDFLLGPGFEARSGVMTSAEYLKWVLLFIWLNAVANDFLKKKPTKIGQH